MVQSVVRVIVAGGLAVVLIGVAGLAWLGRVSRHMTPALSPSQGPLRAGDDRPNWVSTTAPPGDARHVLAPRPCAQNPIPFLADELARQGYAIDKRTDRFLHATWTSPVFGFVDDVELLYDPAAGLLHARSASRVGYSDLGVNRRRLEALFRALDRRDESQPKKRRGNRMFGLPRPQ